MNIKINRSDFLFYMAFIAYYFGVFVTYLAFDDGMAGIIKKGLSLFSILCLMINLIPVATKLTKIYYKKIQLYVFLAIVAEVVRLKDFFLIVMILFALNLYFVVKDVRHLFRFSFFLLLAITFIVISLCAVGVLDNVVTAREGRPRYSLGFYHSNVLPLIVLYLSVYYYMMTDKVTLANFTVVQCCALVVYIICRSRNSVIALELLYMLFFLQTYFKNSRKFKSFFVMASKLATPFMSVFSLVLLNLYKSRSPIALIANDIFNNRIRMANLYYHYQEFKIINLMTNDRFQKIILTLDNGYYYSTARYGVIYLVFLSMVMYYMVRSIIRENRRLSLSVVIVLAAANFIDNGFFSFLFLPFMIYSFHGFVHRKEKADLELLEGIFIKKKRRRFRKRRKIRIRE